MQTKDLADGFTYEPLNGVLKGIAAVFGNVDSGGDRIIKGAFAKTLLERSEDIKVGWQHDLDHPFAIPTVMKEVDRSELPASVLTAAPGATGGLYVEAEIIPTPINEQRKTLMTWRASNGKSAVKGLSIGYLPIREKFLKESGSTVREIPEIKLYEFSPVTIAMNSAAMATDVKGVSFAEVESMVEKAVAELKAKQAAEEEAAFKAASTAPWDGPAQVAEADVSDLRAMCAVVDGDGSTKSDYHLPHHMASAGHPVNENGVKAAAAALSGARGGYQGANAGKAKAHIAAHYHALGLGKAPWESDGGKSADDFTELLTEVELETKAGRMISARNADRLKAAHDHIHDVLGMASHGMTVDTDDAVAPADIEPDADDAQKALELRGRFAVHEAEALLLKAALT